MTTSVDPVLVDALFFGFIALCVLGVVALIRGNNAASDAEVKMVKQYMANTNAYLEYLRQKGRDQQRQREATGPASKSNPPS
jgi:hypothetical protein